MRFEAVPCPPATVRPLRERYRAEMRCQLLFDQMHARTGWTELFALKTGDELAGFGTKATGGPWREQPTILEFYVVPERQDHAAGLFEVLLAQSGARRIETQSNTPLLTQMLRTWAREVVSEKILFEDKFTTELAARGAALRQITAEEDIRKAIAQRNGSGAWQLLWEGAVIGSGSILFHYNPPYGDLAMEIAEAYQRRGFGAYFVQELKRKCRALGVIPAARCDPDNTASRRTLLKTGFVSCGHLFAGAVAK